VWLTMLLYLTWRFSGLSFGCSALFSGHLQEALRVGAEIQSRSRLLSFGAEIQSRLRLLSKTGNASSNNCTIA